MQWKTLSRFFILSRVGLGEFAKLIQARNTLEDLRNRHEFYQHPASLLRNETRLSTRGSECKISVLLQSAFVKFPSKLSKIARERFFNKFISSCK